MKEREALDASLIVGVGLFVPEGNERLEEDQTGIEGGQDADETGLHLSEREDQTDGS